jgi:hypothetical protein
MNPKVKRLWINALESGDYVQGKNYLKQTISGGFSYCCLGVLCDLYDKHSGKSPGFREGAYHISSSREIVYPHNGSTVLPTREVLEWAGLESERGFDDGHLLVLKDGTEYRATGLPDINDNCDLSFKEISSVIKERL